MSRLKSDQIKFSIIMPVHNAEKYLDDSIRSILKQKYSDFELLIVDDNSSDSSEKKCKQYEIDDPRITVFESVGKGVVNARNTAVKKAKGEYVCFCDADDLVDENYLSVFTEVIEQHHPDMIACGYIRNDAGYCTNVHNLVNAGVYEDNTLYEILSRVIHWNGLYQFGINPYLWTKCIKTEIVRPIMKNTNPDIHEGEDAAIVFPCLFKSKKIVVSDDCSYHYMIRSNSVTHIRNFDYNRNICDLYSDFDNKLRETDYYDVALPQLQWYMRMLVYVENPFAFDSNAHVFPFGKVEKDSKIVLYGAGNVGRIYANQVMNQKYCDIVGWVDRNCKGKKIGEFEICNLPFLLNNEYDCIVIAIENESIVLDVKRQLVEMGISAEKIVF